MVAPLPVLVALVQPTEIVASLPLAVTVPAAGARLLLVLTPGSAQPLPSSQSVLSSHGSSQTIGEPEIAAAPAIVVSELGAATMARNRRPQPCPRLPSHCWRSRRSAQSQ